MMLHFGGRGRSASLRVLSVISYLIASVAALAQQPNARDVQSLSAQDAALVQAIGRSDAAAIAAGKVALSRSTPAAIRKYAQLVVDSHGKLLEDRDRVAKLKGWHAAAERSSANGDASLIALREASDEQFARTYLDWSIEHERKALELVRHAASQAQDPNLKALGSNAASHIEPLTLLARELADALASGKLSATGKAPPR